MQATLESGMMAEYGKAILPGLSGEKRLEMFNLILEHEMPWIAHEEAAAKSPEALAAAYRRAKQLDGKKISG